MVILTAQYQSPFTMHLLRTQLFLWPSLLLALCLTHCASDSSEAQAGKSDLAADSAAAAEAEPPQLQLAVCLWDQAGLRSQPGKGKDAKWITAINFGELVTMTGNSESPEGEDRTYIELELSDGKSGWSNGYLFATDALRAVAVQPVNLYKRPELATLTDDTYDRGEIFAISQKDRDGWYEVWGKEKDQSGWVRSQDGLSTDEVDVTVAILVDRAMEEKTPEDQESMLNNVVNNSTFRQSPLLSIVDEKLAEVSARSNLPDNQLYITAAKLNARSDPDTEEDNVVFQLESGDICTILERSKKPTEVSEMLDYWYRIEHEGRQGWVFGYFTSRRMEGGK
jgi:uncharacterized protein YgiM (DUF1202 family)